VAAAPPTTVTDAGPGDAALWVASAGQERDIEALKAATGRAA
jgi:hypothetical protein